MRARTWAEKAAATTLGVIGGVGIALVLAVVSGGCAQTAAADGPAAVIRKEHQTLADGLYAVTLSDGTRCGLYSGESGRSGLDCDWSRSRPSSVER